MAEARRLLGVVVAVLVTTSAAGSFAKDKPKASPSKSGPPAGVTINACGCYHDAKGGCVCTDKKGKCECSGECEPVGCDEKRDKEMQREMAAEIKRAQEDEKRRQAAQEAQENGAPPDASAPPADAPAPKTKRKDAAGKAEKK